MTDDTTSLYEALSRFQWWRRGGLEIRKRLLPPARPGDGPADSGRGLDEWLFAQLGGRAAANVLDVGCGFGASAQRWARLGGGSVTGITHSAFQVAKAAAAARAAGLGDRCRFVRQDFAAPVSGTFDVGLAIEALGHAGDLGAVLRNVRHALAPRGIFLWVEDLLLLPMPADTDVTELASRWCSPPLRDAATARRGLEAAGFRVLREIDLTPQVPVASAASLHARAVRLQRWRRAVPLPFGRRLFDAFLGGVALERLYARSAACYRVWMSEPKPEAV